jgi:AcrR family transcriptional regulator
MRTPWGTAAELRSRRLSPGPGNPPDVVANHQRERLQAAMVLAVAEHGYETARVADLLELSGVSRSGYYKYFENKLDCFLATLDAIVEMVGERIATAVAETDASWEQRLRAGADALLEFILTEPAASRLLLVEAYAAGLDALERLERATAAVERAVGAAFAESPERAGMPADIVHAIVCGIRKTVQTRLRRRTERELIDLMPQLLDWGLSYRPPKERLPRPRRRPDRGVAPVPSPDDPAERILTATTAVVAERGYHAATVVEIATRARMSLSTLYDHLPGKQTAFVATIDRIRGHTISVTAPFCTDGREGGWPERVRSGLDALLGYLAAEPAEAKIAVLDVYAAGPPALDRLDRALRTFEGLLDSDDGGDSSPQVEATVAAIHALVHAHVHRGRAKQLRELTPIAAYIALTPFVGPARASATATAPPRS